MAMMNEIPMGLALLVCDNIIQDKQTNKRSLIGLFDRLYTKNLPCVHPSLSIFVSLTSGKGNYACEVVCRHQETDTGLKKRFTHQCHVGVDVDPECGQHIGRAGFGGERTIAVFCHRHTAGCGEDRRTGGYIECALGIAAGTAGIDRAFRRVHFQCAGAHCHS